MNLQYQHSGQNLHCRTISQLEEMDALLAYQNNSSLLEPLYVSVHKIFLINGDNGGGVSGLFDEHEVLRGFAFHIPGRYQETLVGWTYRFIIDEELRNRHTIQLLRSAQIELAKQAQLDRLYWAVSPEDRLALSVALEPDTSVATAVTPYFGSPLPGSSATLLTELHFDSATLSDNPDAHMSTFPLQSGAELLHLCSELFEDGYGLYTIDDHGSTCSFLSVTKS